MSWAQQEKNVNFLTLFFWQKNKAPPKRGLRLDCLSGQRSYFKRTIFLISEASPALTRYKYIPLARALAEYSKV
jgi:hypothetical protein